MSLQKQWEQKAEVLESWLWLWNRLSAPQTTAAFCLGFPTCNMNNVYVVIMPQGVVNIYTAML